MSFFEELATETTCERQELLASPLIEAALRGEVTREQYLAFLTEAYHHVSQTVPLLMACGSRLDADHEWLRSAVAHYIKDEYGHENWILNDIASSGGDADAVRHSQPSQATELMVSYAWDTIQRRNPVGFFGMVYVLEGTSVAIATMAANTIQKSLGLPDRAFTYLLSHGDIDQDHVKFLESLVNRIEDPRDRRDVIHCARRFFYLYGQIFRTLPGAANAGSAINSLRGAA